MPPHATSFEKSCSGDRQRQEAGGQLLRGPGQRSASFHGRGAEQRHQLPKQRPKTQPDLLAGVRGRSFRAADGGEPLAELAVRRTPSKVLVNVTVQRSLWPLHVMASAEWSVADLVAASVGIYVKEGRRPLLPATDPSTFGLHYSQFSLESLDPREKVMELGSRSFFLCPRSSSAAVQTSSSSCSSAGASGVRNAGEAPTSAGEPPAWLRYMPFWPTM
ncbi:unnamed protein product [Triticum aestivum]|uniref:DUF7054 domain-containing protein n=2 Tax=Triticum aestivum TaxID=4565 RepID=A0A9R1ET85_WHEAT|nr:uncharacterized protein LOC123053219 [Triticum aestivum]KAF7016392.1 hypothetical protein CFC21_030012 [Triticum aestivum]SPT18299.1 unnamed protein product [Triticum aestivum]